MIGPFRTRAAALVVVAASWLCVPEARAASADTAASAGAAASAGVRRFALVIGNNAPPRADLDRLRYADDDAVRWAVLLSTLGATVETLTNLDARASGCTATRSRP